MKKLAGPCRFEETTKKSRFIAYASPVETQAETLAFYESVADPQATHNCWAWRIDHVHRSNDDGEPSGSGGRPILSVIEGRDLELTRRYQQGAGNTSDHYWLICRDTPGKVAA